MAFMESSHTTWSMKILDIHGDWDALITRLEVVYHDPRLEDLVASKSRLIIYHPGSLSEYSYLFGGFMWDDELIFQGP